MSTNSFTTIILLGATLGACSGETDDGTGVGTQGFAAERRSIELCANVVDDDLDGQVDEMQCEFGPGEPISDGGVVPEQWSDNPNCQQMGFGYGFKIDGGPSGTFHFTSAEGELTGGAPADATNSVTLVSDGTYFDWTATLGIDAVFVKGGPAGGNLYIYYPEDLADGGLSTPDGGSAISHIEFCYDYELSASKTAEPEYTREYDWELAKSVTPAELRMFVGELGTFSYQVEATRTVSEYGHAIAGTVVVNNPTPFTVGFAISDSIDGVGPVAVTCPSYELAPGASVTCTYDQTVGGKLGTLNTATITSSNAMVDGATATASISWGEPTAIVGYPEVQLTDSMGLIEQLGDSATFNYTMVNACSTGPSDYSGGEYHYSVVNTAQLTETGDSDSETVDVYCYAPVVAKDASTGYTRSYTWTIEKTVDPESHTGMAGDSFLSSYLVTLDQSIDEYGFAVSGTITVANPHPAATMTVYLEDAVDGVPATLACGGMLVIGPASAATCDYQAGLGDGDLPAPGLNVATVTFNSIPFTASAAYAFGEPTLIEGYPVVSVTDSQPQAPAPWGGISGDVGLPYPADFACPTDAAMYTDGLYQDSVPNRATIVETGAYDDALVGVTCYLPAHAKVVKAVSEGPDEIGALPFVFSLRDPTDAVVEVASLSAAGEVGFMTELRTPGTWRVVETLPAGWLGEGALECSFTVSFPASAGDTFTCNFSNIEMSRVNLLKLTDGVVDPARSWTFGIWDGGFGGTQLASATTLDDADGLLTFGELNLDPGELYTVCEHGVAAGWTSFWMVDSDGDGTAETTVVPYNPNADDSPPADVGNRCVDIGAGTELPLVVGDTLKFAVDNTYPGGEPRTPGYWKNWNRCTNGGQAANADRNGGWAEGFWLVEDVLDPEIGGGIVWDDMLVHVGDIPPFAISQCAVAVDILDARVIGNPAVVGDGKKAASDGAYTLARALLAAQLNFAAGAATCPEALDAALDGEELLDQVNFNGTGSYLRKGARYEAALSLAETLDEYNNGLLCGP